MQYTHHLSGSEYQGTFFRAVWLATFSKKTSYVAHLGRTAARSRQMKGASLEDMPLFCELKRACNSAKQVAKQFKPGRLVPLHPTLNDGM